MQFNRPAMVDKLASNSVPLPKSVDDEHMDRGQPSDHPPVIAFYIKTLEVFEIMARVMQNSASLNRGVATFTSRDQYHLLFGDSHINHLTETLKLDQSLMIWASSLPSHLRPDPITGPNQKYNPIFHRQANVLRSRYLHTRILLFRPILSRFCLAQPDTTYTSSSSARDMTHESLPQHLALACSNLCLRAAHDAIHLIYCNLDRETITGPVPQWWNCVLFTYSAATVLQAARLRPMGSPNYNIDTSWNHALEIIHSFDPLSPLVQRCLLALEMLAGKITETTAADHNHIASTTAAAGPSTLRPDGGSAMTARSVPTPNAARWTEKDGPSPASAPPPTPGEAVDAANALLQDMGDAMDTGVGVSGEGTMGFDFDLNDMSWLTSAPVNL